MASKDLLSVKEVAELAGVSVQAIYQRMEKDFKPYVVEVEKRKWLKYSVLKHLADKDSSKKVETCKEVEILEKMVEMLEKENELKQSTIDSLNARLEEEHKHLLDLTDKVGSTLQIVTQTQLAGKLIQGQQQMSDVEEVEKKHWWNFWK